MFKAGERVVYYGSSAKMYKRRGTILGKFGDRWRVELEGGFIVFANEQEIAYLQQSFGDKTKADERYLDDLI